jgi:hypothetical protein
MDRERTNTNTTLLTEQQRRCSLCYGRGGGFYGLFSSFPLDVARCMRIIALAHLFFAVVFFGSVLEHTFFFPYFISTVPIRVAGVGLTLLNLLLAALSIGSLNKGNLGGKRDRMFSSYVLINCFATILVFFLFLVEFIEGVYVVIARYYATFSTPGGFDTRRMGDMQAAYAEHPLWGICACFTLLVTIFLLHICFGRVACNAKHQGQYAGGVPAASGGQQFQHSLLREGGK